MDDDDCGSYCCDFSEWGAGRAKMHNKQLAGFVDKLAKQNGYQRNFGFTLNANGEVMDLLYCKHNLNISVAAASFGSNTFRGNSIWSVDYTAFSSDDANTVYQMSQIHTSYNSYIVYASTIYLDLYLIDSAGAESPCQVTLLPVAGLNMATLPSITSQSQVDVQPFSEVNSVFAGTRSLKKGRNRLRLQMRADTKKLVVDSTAVKIAGLTGNTNTAGVHRGASPSYVWYWRLLVNNTDGSNAANLYADVRIVFKTLLFNREVVSSGSV